MNSYKLELKVEDAFKQTQIKVLENLKDSYLGEYMDSMKTKVQEECTKHSIDIRKQLNVI